MALFVVGPLPGCGEPIDSVSLALIPDGTRAVSITVVHPNQIGIACAGRGVSVPGDEVLLTATAQVVHRLRQSGAADLLGPFQYTIQEVNSPSGVTIDEVPLAGTLVFVEAFALVDGDDVGVATGCGETQVREDQISAVRIELVPVGG